MRTISVGADLYREDMEPTTRLSTGAALTAIRAALAAIDHPQRTHISHHERLTLLQTARRAQGQLAGLVAMLTGEAEANHSAEAVAGTQLPTLLGQQEHLDVRDALRSVTQARDIAHHNDVARRVIDGNLSPQHAQAIRRTLDTLPHTLNTGQRDHAARLLRHSLDVLHPVVASGTPVVGLEPSCTAVSKSWAITAAVTAQCINTRWPASSIMAEECPSQ